MPCDSSLVPRGLHVPGPQDAKSSQVLHVLWLQLLQLRQQLRTVNLVLEAVDFVRFEVAVQSLHQVAAFDRQLLGAAHGRLLHVDLHTDLRLGLALAQKQGDLLDLAGSELDRSYHACQCPRSAGAAHMPAAIRTRAMDGSSTDVNGYPLHGQRVYPLGL